MSLIINIDDFNYVIEKHIDDAINSGRNHAYAKGLRDSVKIARSMAVCTDESVPVVKGGIPRENVWWYECGKCHTSVNPGDQFCCRCGVPIGWPEGSAAE